MFSRKWMPGVWKPKNLHSLEHLKYLYNVLCKHQTVTEQNLSLLVETLRSISEILIWGDQNDSTVFDFFLEKNMLLFFLRFMRQKSGRYICVQLLQTLNILFDNISNETSVYYLLSNNHINSIIIHKFDFSDEEVMAYYISFLKTLSLRLNRHTIHFFYNEHTNDFALYTEAIKFFNHPESMVRIAVRTITLNVYRACNFEPKLDENNQTVVDNNSMLRYIRDKTAAPYFSNLVWFIGNHVIELNSCVQRDIDHNSRDKLKDLVAEHLDHLHYLNDILCLDIEELNYVLTDHLLNRLFIPLYVDSLLERSATALSANKESADDERSDVPRISPVVSLFLLSQVFLIIHYGPLVKQLSEVIINGEPEALTADQNTSSSPVQQSRLLRCFMKPTEDLKKTFDTRKRKHRKAAEVAGGAAAASDDSLEAAVAAVEETALDDDDEGLFAVEAVEAVEILADGSSEQSSDVEEADSSSAADNSESAEESISAALDSARLTSADSFTAGTEPNPAGTEPDSAGTEPNPNSTDEEKLMRQSTLRSRSPVIIPSNIDLDSRPYLKAVFNTLDCKEEDYRTLFALCLLHALGKNSGISQELLDTVRIPTDFSESKHHYNAILVQQLIAIMSHACQSGSKVRLATLELTINVLRSLVYSEGQCFLQDEHLAAVEGVREEATLLLRSFYKSEEIFLDMFEDEYRELSNRPLNVENLMMDASILLPPTGTPLTGIDFTRRLPCGEVERARRAIRVLFMVRKLSFMLRQEVETQLPLTKEEECVKVDDVLDLNNSDLIACTVVTKDSKKERRFLVIDVIQLILVEPDAKRLGWGVVRFVGFLQDVEVTGDKDDSRCLHITIHRPTMNSSIGQGRPQPLLSARFIFDDHIRCMAAKQRLTKGRLKARQRKMQMIATLLELPQSLFDSMHVSGGSSVQSATSLRANQRGAGLPSGSRLPGGARIPGGAVPGRSHASSRHPVGVEANTSDVKSQSSDHTDSSVQRSVFASVDRVPGFNAVKEHGAKDGMILGKTRHVKTASRPGSASESGAVVKAGQKQKLLTQAMQVAMKSRERAAAKAGGFGISVPGGAGRVEGPGEIEVEGVKLRNKPSGRTSRKKSEAGLETTSGIPIYRSPSGLAARRSSTGSKMLGNNSTSPSPDRLRMKANSMSSDQKRNYMVDTSSSNQSNGRAENESYELIVAKKATSLGPKTLKPADGIPVSLVVDSALPKHPSVLDSPVKLLPPARVDDIQLLTTPAEASSHMTCDVGALNELSPKSSRTSTEDSKVEVCASDPSVSDVGPRSLSQNSVDTAQAHMFSMFTDRSKVETTDSDTIEEVTNNCA